MIPDKPYEISPVIPRKFSTWRGKNYEQKKAVEFILGSPEKYLILQMPTGYGKSLVAVSAGLLLGQKKYIIVPDTHLAKQYANSFDVPVVYGRKNYPCTYDEKKTAAECPFERNIQKCPVVRETMEYYGASRLSELDCLEIPCPYVRARCIAAHEKKRPVVMTYDYFYYAVVKAGILDAPSVLIIDEAHLFPEKFKSWVSISANINDVLELKKLVQSNIVQRITALYSKNKKLVSSIRKLNRKKYKMYFEKLSKLPEDVMLPDEIESVLNSLDDALSIVKTIVSIVSGMFGVNFDDVEDAFRAGGVTGALMLFPESSKEKVYPFLKMWKILSAFGEMRKLTVERKNMFYPDGDVYRYILYRRENKIVINTISPGLEFEDVEKKLGLKKVVFLSATVIPRLLVEELKLYSSYNVFEAEPITPEESRKVFYYPYGKLYRDSLDQKIFSREYVNGVIDRVLRTFDDYRGIILVASRRDIETLTGLSKYERRLIPFYGSQKEKLKSLEKLKKSKNGVLVSTAWEGIDLTDELSRFQIIYQIPYMYLGDPYVFVRKKVEPKWYVLTALNRIVQGAGRSVRHSEDFSVTYIFDARLDALLARYGDFLPKWFLRSIEKTNSLDIALTKGIKTLKKLSQERE